MTGQRRAFWRRAGWMIGAVVGILVGWQVNSLWSERQLEQQETQREEVFGPVRAAFEPPQDPAGWGPMVQYLAENTTAKGGDLVIDPMLSDAVDDESRQQIRQTLAQSQAPLHLAYVRNTDARHLGYNQLQLAERWAAMARQDGHYVVLFDDSSTDVAAYGMRDQISIYDTEGKPGPTLQRMAQEMQGWPIESERVEDWYELKYAHETPAGFGVFLGLLAAGFLLWPLFMVFRSLVARWRREPVK